MSKFAVQEVIAWTEIGGDGQKITAAILVYPEMIESQEINREDFQVTGRNILKAYPSNRAMPGYPEKAGCYVILELDARDVFASTIEVIGHGRTSKIHIKKAEAEVTQKRILKTMNHRQMAAVTLKSQRSIDPIADQFQSFEYHLPDTNKVLSYQLFIPEISGAHEKYPLVLFMHDLGACSDDLLAPLAQGNGAVVWAEKEAQKKHPCFVLAPLYTRQTADDDFTVTWEAEASINLIKALCTQYPIDTSRIYGTGQSMGCMMLSELNLRHPGFFAASFLVAGQWNPQTMAKAKDENLWALVSERDAKAFPIMGACMAAIEAAGQPVARGHINAKDALSRQNQKLKEIVGQGRHLMFTWYEGDSVLEEGKAKSPGAFHMATWRKAYTLETIQDWMFSQKSRKHS